jgi:Spy/CpxP family protein refolding chaperone
VNKSWQVVLAFVVVFLAGGAIGSVFTLRFLTPPPPKVDPNSAVLAKPEEVGPVMLRRWLLNSNQLGLTAAQREKIRPIFFDTAEDLQRANVERNHSYFLLLEHMQDEIASLLTPAQRDKFYQLIQNQRDKLNRFVKERQRRALLQADEVGAEPAK